jgi:uncharacterized phage protein (TIGR01671 family)
MNRIIKFRAWDEKENKMTPIVNKFVCFSGVIWENKRDGFEGVDNIVSTNRLEVMQFTGLFDKNGKEIYEGDVITYGFKTKDFSDLVLHTGKIFFDEYMFLVDGDNVNNEWHSINRIHFVEVIGNIYEK